MHMRTTGFISFELFHLGSNEIKNPEKYLNKIEAMFAEGKQEKNTLEIKQQKC